MLPSPYGHKQAGELVTLSCEEEEEEDDRKEEVQTAWICLQSPKSEEE